MNTTVLTIGYQGRHLMEVIQLIVQHRIAVLIDVRSNAWSRKPGFSRRMMESSLREGGIQYVHIPELGVPSSRRRDLRTDDDYLTLLNEYREGLEADPRPVCRLMEVVASNRVALLCFERDPARCHRGVLADILAGTGCTVQHL